MPLPLSRPSPLLGAGQRERHDPAQTTMTGMMADDGLFLLFFSLFFLRSNSLERALGVDGVSGHRAGWIVFWVRKWPLGGWGIWRIPGGAISGWAGWVGRVGRVDSSYQGGTGRFVSSVLSVLPFSAGRLSRAFLVLALEPELGASHEFFSLGIWQTCMLAGADLAWWCFWRGLWGGRGRVGVWDSKGKTSSFFKVGLLSSRYSSSCSWHISSVFPDQTDG